MARSETEMIIDYTALQQALVDMQPRQKLYELIKAEMKRRGRWKNKNRGSAPPTAIR
jgi:hypothetical protein